MRRARKASWLVILSMLASCRERRPEGDGAPARPSANTAAEPVLPSARPSAEPPPWAKNEQPPAAPKGMVWIPPGALVAGTPPGTLPRIADEEMAGEQVVMKGFFISIYPYPNEEAAIPLSGITQPEAAALCAETGKRLCTELEWERACKGPDNTLYEYGNRYRPEVCATGEEPRMLPSGMRVACRSDFGVHDLHGGLWEWTSSDWGRGEKAALVSVRGGNARAGEVVGRCANAMGRPPGERSSQVGFRCCMGPVNDATVALVIDRKAPLVRKDPMDKTVARAIERLVKEKKPEGLSEPERFRATGLWYWHPIGNEELVALGGCSGPSFKRTCGAAIARMGLDGTTLLVFADSGLYPPAVQVDRDPHKLWVYGGDDRSHFRRAVTYLYGSAAIGEVQLNVRPRALPPAPVRRRK